MSERTLSEGILWSATAKFEIRTTIRRLGNGFLRHFSLLAIGMLGDTVAPEDWGILLFSIALYQIAQSKSNKSFVGSPFWQITFLWMAK
jgi:hypothetical protein